MRRKRLIVRKNQRRHIAFSNDVRHRKRLTAARHAEQGLLALARLQAANKLPNSLRLIAGRLVIGMKNEVIHAAIITSLRNADTAALSRSDTANTEKLIPSPLGFIRSQLLLEQFTA